MHEFGIIQDIFRVLLQVVADKKLRSVQSVVIRIGKLRQVVPEFLQFAFATLAKDSVAAGATLIIEFVPITMHCNSCGREFTVTEQAYFCPQCESGDLTLLSGKELMLVSVEGEIDDENRD